MVVTDETSVKGLTGTGFTSRLRLKSERFVFCCCWGFLQEEGKCFV